MNAVLYNGAKVRFVIMSMAAKNYSFSVNEW
jgi:hypothetical protein